MVTATSASRKVRIGKTMPVSGFSRAQESTPGDWADSTT
jgi:hypothetical protein